MILPDNMQTIDTMGHSDLDQIVMHKDRLRPEPALAAPYPLAPRREAQATLIAKQPTENIVAIL
ncbi:MAG: hypothetical protein WBC93_05280 [Sulfitobacter sp.]